jgi:penicillin-binding protein 1A
MKIFFRIMTVTAAVIASTAIVIAATYSGAAYYFKPSLPSANTMRDVQLQTPLKVYSRDGRLIAQLGEKRRTPVRYDDIPDVVIEAFLAAEDDRFFEHPGFDYQGIIRAVANLLMTGSRSQGGSTITQQLARVYFLTRDRTFARKAKELILATQIEQEFSKEEILSLYLNKIFLGQRAYGIGAAAEVYFGKRLAELNVAEAAVIAGIPKAPSVLNPVSNVERTTERRAYVLRRMLELDFIDEDAYEEALATPVQSRLHGPRVELEAPYVAEMVRADMIRQFGNDAYIAGYKVITTIDSRLQTAAQNALRTSLLEYDRRHGYRGPVATDLLVDLDPEIPAEMLQIELARRLQSFPQYDYLYLGIVMGTDKSNAAEVFLPQFGFVSVPWEQLKWRPYIDDNRIGTAPDSAADIVAEGDAIYLLQTAEKGWMLAQLPNVQGAFAALDPRDGATVALCGGFDFFSSSFNRAVQSKRQPGSSFKPFIYSAALENGYTTATLVNDAPVVFNDAALEETWRPENYSRKFHGPTRLREALVRSLNLVSVRILLGTGIGTAIEHIKAFGLPESALPRNTSLALGAGGISPWDIAAGYASFASGGYRVDHYLVERVLDADNNIVFEADNRYVCPACESPWVSAATKSDETLSKAKQAAAIGEPTADPLITIVPRQSEPAFGGDEVPKYRDTKEMIAHGMEWQPSRTETPAFYKSRHNPAKRAITAENAYLIYDMMRDVIQRGTGRRARELGRRDLAGKTGTSNERRDAWFSGYNGNLVATAWVGFDEARSLGAGEEGSRTALPMWKYFMAEALQDAPDGSINQPPGILTVRIVPDSGLVAPAQYSGAIFELFREGDVPDLHAKGSGSTITGESFEEYEDDDESIF